MKWKGFFDGAAQPTNPGHASIGVVILDSKENTIYEKGEYIGYNTNNYAEYTALIDLLEFCVCNGIDDIVICGDSQLVINQMNGIYQVKSCKIWPLFMRAQQLKRKIKNISFEWVPREKNKRADTLSKKALNISDRRSPRVFALLEIDDNYMTNGFS